MACKAYFTEGWDEMVRGFEKSSLRSQREDLSQLSPRFDRLRQFIDEMLSNRWWPTLHFLTPSELNFTQLLTGNIIILRN
ncbi:hypothetical protein GGR55DRAFT_622137 [Xylaria sp. FL0064]|nr:hypothetical protein GGR55DRAFT_622137 [Xylaria sp. FL0064]